MSKFILIGLLLSVFVAQNRNLVLSNFSDNNSKKAITRQQSNLFQKKKSHFSFNCNDTSGLRLLSGMDTVTVQSFMETINEPVTAKYLLKTSRWGDTLAAFQNAYRAVLPVPFELFMPLETPPEFPFPHLNAAPLKDSIYPFKIVPSKNDQRMAGISTFDLALISRHVLDIQPFTSPYKLIAADVNKDGYVDATDMIIIRRLILHVDTSFRQVPHWVFIPKTYVIPQEVPPLDSIPQAYYFNAFTYDLPNPFEFTTIKMGDVNNSFHDTTSVPINLLSRNNVNTLVLTTENKLIEKDKTYEISLKCAKTEQFIALQGTFSFGTEGVNRKTMGDFETVESETLTHFGEQNVNKIKNQFAFSWNDVTDKVFSKNEAVFKIKFKADADGRLSDYLKINDDLSENFVYTEGGETRKIALQFTETKKDFYVFQNEPNPFISETNFKIEINSKNNEPTPTKLTVFDENGKMYFQRAQLFTSGTHLLRLESNEMGLSKSGIYFLNVETPTGKQTIKLLKL